MTTTIIRSNSMNDYDDEEDIEYVLASQIQWARPNSAMVRKYPSIHKWLEGMRPGHCFKLNIPPMSAEPTHAEKVAFNLALRAYQAQIVRAHKIFPNKRFRCARAVDGTYWITRLA